MDESSEIIKKIISNLIKFKQNQAEPRLEQLRHLELEPTEFEASLVSQTDPRAKAYLKESNVDLATNKKQRMAQLEAEIIEITEAIQKYEQKLQMWDKEA